ncbi:MAG: hypothetical protein NC112_09615 [Oxalobacter formigenes]|nr:hypothetical protein [Oxalobacter formigenes]
MSRGKGKKTALPEINLFWAEKARSIEGTARRLARKAAKVRLRLPHCLIMLFVSLCCRKYFGITPFLHQRTNGKLWKTREQVAGFCQKIRRQPDSYLPDKIGCGFLGNQDGS